MERVVKISTLGEEERSSAHTASMTIEERMDYFFKLREEVHRELYGEDYDEVIQRFERIVTFVRRKEG